MLANYISILKAYYNINPYFSFALQIVLLFAVIILVSFLIILLLDSLYRPNTPQYHEHWVFDKVIPIIVLFLPGVLIFSLSEAKVTLLEKYIYILLIHCFILVPIMYNWSKHRNWSLTKESFYKPWHSSKIFLYISTAIIYPAIWGIYLSVLRILRLGNSFNLGSVNFSPFELSVIVLTILLWPYISIWVRFLLWRFLDLKIFLWNETSVLLYYVHLYLLSYKIYFKTAEILYKVSFLWHMYFIHYPLLYPKWPRSRFRIILRKVYLNPLVIYVIIIVVALLEIVLTKGYIYYTLYVIILLLLLKPFLSFLKTFNGPSNSWVQTCCYSDYSYTAWETPHYPKRFWLSFNDMREKFNHYPQISDKDNELLQNLILQLKDVQRYERKYNTLRLSKYYAKKKTSYNNRLRLSYHDWTQVRWMQTQTLAVMKTVSRWHNLTSFFARSWTDKIALVNETWSHYHTIQQAERLLPKIGVKSFSSPTAEIYENFDSPIGKSIDAVVTHNCMTNFKELIGEHKVSIAVFTKGIRLDTKSQPNPDIVINTKSSNLVDKRAHGMDQKAYANPKESSNQIFSNITKEKYEQLMEKVKQNISTKLLTVSDVINMRLAIDELVDSCSDIASH